MADDVVTHPRRPARAVVAVFVVGLLAAGCGGGGESDSDGFGVGDTAATDSGAAESSDIDVCGLLSDSEIESLLGEVMIAKPADADSPYPGCSWNTGRLIVQIASGDSLVFAPDEECPSVDLGEEAAMCPGSLQFLVNGSRVIVQTIENLTEDQLVAVGRALEPKLAAGS